MLWEGRKVRGREGARILSERQLEGLSRLAGRGVLCKVNAVVIPGVNDRHLPEVVREVRRRGAFLVNLLPLISAPEHGTHYGLTGQRGPTPEELERLQATCELDTKLMRHCRQCRADAVGKLGQDRFAEFTRARLPPGPVREAAELRAEHREAVERVRARAELARQAALARAAAAPQARRARVAVATKGGGQVDQHFGHATEFLIYEVGREGARLLGLRKVETYCQGGEGEDDALAATLRALEGCQAVLVARVGRCPSSQLEAAGMEPVTAFAFQPIEASCIAWWEGWAAKQATPALAPVAAAEVA
ncbi:MAG: NifB/NifX family molybdenum-iron cluster-binding protein [Anaeromyxobacter sp.]